jgi:hypothetical protein
MPFQLKADDIRKRAAASFDTRVKTATEQKIERIDRVTSALIDALSTELDAHFERQEKAQASPYPDRPPTRGYSDYEMGAVIIVKNFKRTDEIRLALSSDDEDVEIWRRVKRAFEEAGYYLETVSTSQTGSVGAFIRDPEFRP